MPGRQLLPCSLPSVSLTLPTGCTTGLHLHPPLLLRYAVAACDDGDDDYLSEGLQIIGMSATLPNVDKVAT